MNVESDGNIWIDTAEGDGKLWKSWTDSLPSSLKSYNHSPLMWTFELWLMILNWGASKILIRLKISQCFSYLPLYPYLIKSNFGWSVMLCLIIVKFCRCWKYLKPCIGPDWKRSEMTVKCLLVCSSLSFISSNDFTYLCWKWCISLLDFREEINAHFKNNKTENDPEKLKRVS